MKKLLKDYWGAWIGLGFLGCALIIGIIGLNKQYIIKKNLYEEALMGNENAILLLRKYDQPWKLHEYVLKEAISGNKNALKILKIDNENIKDK